MNRTARILAFSLSIFLTASLYAESTKDWPQYRGPGRDGVSLETGILETWPQDGPTVVWERGIGTGFSGLAATGGKLYTMMAEEGKEYACAFDAGTGEELWRVAVGDEFDSTFGDGPRSTPAVAGGLAFFLSSYGNLVALDAADGSERWQLDLKTDFASVLPQHGFSTAPMVDGDLLIIEIGGGRGKAYAALDGGTGETRWMTQDGTPTYTSPIVVTVGGERHFVSIGANKIFGIRPDGELAWSHDWDGGIAMPLFVAPDKLFFSSGQGSMLARLTVDDGSVELEQVWQSNEMKNDFNSSVIWDGTVYGFDGSILKAVSLATGERAWAKRGFGKGSLILAGGHLIILGERGLLAQAAATPESFVEEGRFQAIDGKCWTSPTLAHGRLYIRNLKEMKCFDLRG